ncbi:ArsR family transcriptional regulator [Lujinxingia litoralis]|uniref:ArsR family transcriptional regulator n=1 Tax=Lujinxingia litoralis TaxID=2211119 RepID=A0A328C3Z7_9DELT|nr:metalloregulator ArsR/SmtB family transcription factor [Lujinxingia litoralis]RAL20669.1 ArsR family transcriptional regulator [Lujinxingia litoralis]
MTPRPARTFKNAAYGHLARVGKALASPARLEILELLAQAPASVDALASEVGQSVANTSHHLQALKRAHLVRSERQGVQRIYHLADEDVAGLLRQLQAVAAHHVGELQELTRAYFEGGEGLEALDGPALLEKLRADEVTLIDVRPEHEYLAGHLPGALSMPLSELETRLESLPRGRTIVAYCRGPYCTFSAEAVSRLRARGYDARRSEVSVQDAVLLGGGAR